MIAKNLQHWKDLVCARDKYICQLQTSPACKHDYSAPSFFDDKGVNQFVCGDHLKTKGAHPELMLDTTNGKCVCKSCHTLRHKGQIPDGYLEPVSESFYDEKENAFVFTNVKAYGKVNPEDRETVRGKPFNYTEIEPIPGTEMFIGYCNKCQKYRAGQSGLCLRCEPFKGHFLKEKKAKSKATK